MADDEQTPLVHDNEPRQQYEVTFKTPDDFSVEIVNRPSITPSQRRFGYSLCAMAALAQALRATGLHAILSATPIPLSISFLSMSIVFNIGALIGCFLFKVDISSLWKVRKTFMIWSFRSVSSGIMKYLNFVSLRYVAVGTALTIFATGPSLACIFAFLTLSDPITWSDLGILVINIIGVLFVISPGTGAADFMSEGGDVVASDSASWFKPGLMAAVGCAFFQAATTTMEKALSNQHMHVFVVMLAIGVGCTLAWLVLIKWEDYTTAKEYPMATGGLFIVSFLTFITHGLLNWSMKYCRPGLALVVRSLSVPFSFFFGFVLLSEAPTLAQLFGVGLVFSSLVVIGLQ